MLIALKSLTDIVAVEEDNSEIFYLEKEIKKDFEIIMNSKFGTFIEEDDAESENLESINVAMDYSGIKNALSAISEDMSNKEKISKYINIIFPRLILTHILKTLKKINISFSRWFNDQMPSVIKKDNIAKEKYYKIFHKDSYQISGKQEETLALRFLLSSDYDFWINIINSLKNIVSKIVTPINMEYLNSVTHALKVYRNETAHSGNFEFSNEDLVRVLTIITMFAKKAHLHIEAALIEKRLCYERYCCYNISGEGWLPTSYSEIDFSSYHFSKKTSLCCWKDVITRKNCAATIPLPIVAKDFRFYVSSITNHLFDFSEGKAFHKDKIVKKATKFFQNYLILLPSCIAGENFGEYLSICYPFHPAFFLLLKEKIKTSPEYVFVLAKNAVEKAYEDSEYSNSFIMPYEIDINIEEGISEEDKSIKDLLVEKFAYSYLRKMDPWRLVPNPHGWCFLERLFLKDDPYIEAHCNKYDVNYAMIKEITFVILLLGLHSLYIKGYKDTSSYNKDLIWQSGIIPDREWIRFCLLKNETNVTEMEKAIKFIPYCVYFINHHEELFANEKIREGLYEFFIPLKEKENVENFFSRVDGLLEKNTPKLDFSKFDELYDKERDREKHLAVMQHATIKPEEKTKYTDNILKYKLEDIDIMCNENKMLTRKEYEYQLEFITYLSVRDYFNGRK